MQRCWLPWRLGDFVFLGQPHTLGTASRIASMPDFLIEPSSFKYFIRRTVDLVLASGSGRAPGAASTISMWIVFEPISSTPSRVVRERRLTMIPIPDLTQPVMAEQRADHRNQPAVRHHGESFGRQPTPRGQPNITQTRLLYNNHTGCRAVHNDSTNVPRRSSPSVRASREAA